MHGTQESTIDDREPVCSAAPSEPPLSSRLQQLLRTHQAEVRRFVASRVGAGADADDIAQQTLLQAFVSFPSFRGDNLRPWLFSIARRLILDLYREQARYVSIDEDSFWDSETVLQTTSTFVQAECELRERIQCCLDCIRTLLPPLDEVAVLLSDVHGFTDRESATRLHMNLPAFKFMLHKARARLHAAAADEQPGNQCPLVSKTGVASACPGCAHGGGTWRSGAVQRSGLGEAALVTLRSELVDALSREDSP